MVQAKMCGGGIMCGMDCQTPSNYPLIFPLNLQIGNTNNAIASKKAVMYHLKTD